jgi:hypothetical protein
MPSDTSAQPTAKSPILAAVGISLAIGLGAVLGTTDIATIEDAVTGKWFTRGYTETQQGHTVAIAALEQSIGGVTRDIDFVAARAGAAVRRNEDQAAARFAQIDAEIAALKDKVAGVQLTQLLSRPDTLGAPAASDATGLRSSLTELTAAHHNSVAAITRRLDRIEVKVGLSTDITAPVASAIARKTIRRAVKVRRPPAFPSSDPVVSSPLDRGHLFTVKPVSQRAPLRLSKLPD